ncbi:survival factor 1 [Colletotrichum kahawae]|uniref:Survival factor 1 n=1 Tax=Colletotrichum kahawae TaxID=34407 RepID=A0AAE0D7M8_COLKA|nr:survival factor 1 [Colletotrichum kahawae]
MFKWAQQKLADVAGTQEPIYGPSAIKSVAEEAKEITFTELTKDHLKWIAADSTSVETQSFYLMGDEGHIGMAQVIYSNVGGIRTTCQFNVKIWYPNNSKPMLWEATPLNHYEISEDRYSFFADDCAVELSADGTFYTIKSMNSDNALVNLKVTRTSPGFHAGKTGKTLFGTDLSKPWGTMRHAFWPRCAVEGTITTKAGPVNFTGRGFYVYALQGMKPHHAAAKWNFVDFQGPDYSAVMMEYTTPPSYGSTTVSVGGIAKDGELIYGGVTQTATHTKSKSDSVNEWPEPEEIKFTWTGKDKDGKAVDGSIVGALEERLDRVDVLAEVPGFVKKIVAGTAGTKPYIYQFCPTKNKLSLKLKIGDQEISEEGLCYCESTFISE